MRVLLAVVAFGATASGQTMGLNCRYGGRVFARLGSLYTCQADVVGNASNFQTIDFVNGNHVPPNSFHNVRFLRIDRPSRTFGRLPANLQGRFPSLIALQATGCGLHGNLGRELSGFPNLQAVDLSRNLFQWVSNDWFESNLRLRWIDLRMNEIQNVEWLAFTRHSQLEYLDFGGNFCTGLSAHNHNEVVRLLPRLAYDHCPFN